MIKMLSNDWINLTFILIFALLVFNKLMFQKRFVLLTTGILNKKYFSVYIKDSPLIASTFNAVFFVINVLTIGLSLYFLTKESFQDSLNGYNYTIYLYILLVLVLYFILKMAIVVLFNFLLSTLNIAKQFSFFNLSFRSLSSIVLLPFLLLHQYSLLDKEISLTILLSVFIALTAIQYIYSSYLIIAKKQHSLLYIILYLCTLEIIPTVIYIKLVFITIGRSSFSI